MNIRDNTLPGNVLYLSHGGGPLPLLGDASHQDLMAFLQDVVRYLGQPAAIVVISAHWEAKKTTITSGLAPSLIYDYYGFPEESYQIKYPAPGNPRLAKQIFDLLAGQGIDAELDERRGFDHGVFIPLKVMYPEAAIPCVQVSLLNSLNPAEHVRMGKALAGLMKENILVIGSGFSFHNMRAFFSPRTGESQSKNTSFERWLIETCSSRQITEDEREQRLINWVDAPAARYCHPREEHLLPLHVCYGIARSVALKVFSFEVMGKKASAYLWQNTAS